MTDTTEKQEATAAQSVSAAKINIKTETAPVSPTLSDRSSDSEGKPVREKLQETRIDVLGTSNSTLGIDPPINDLSDGFGSTLDQSTSGSESEHGRLQRKRSREDFEDGHEMEKQYEKQVGPIVHPHARKKSRDVTKDAEAGRSVKPTAGSISRIEEADTEMTSPNRNPSGSAQEKTADAVSSPKNKRTHDQVEKDTEHSAEVPARASANGKPTEDGEEERDSKRLRDKDEDKTGNESLMSSPKATFEGGFANTSGTSPFAAISAKIPSSKTSDKTEPLPQTSNEKFKLSGFGSFAASTTSPFSGLASVQANSASPFGSAGEGKARSFAENATLPLAQKSGFSTIPASGKPGFGGSSFGGSSGSGFAGLGGTGPGLTSFGTPGKVEITGLKSKSGQPFGAAVENESSDEEDGENSETEKDKSNEEARSSQPSRSQQPQETGEEGEVTAWIGRAKLYTMVGESGGRAWKERGTGPLKLNVTVDEPKRARFVLRADGTYRLVLNAAVTKHMVFGGDNQGEKPKDGRLVFHEPTGEGVLEMHLLKLKAENAVKLWEEVHRVQESEL